MTVSHFSATDVLCFNCIICKCRRVYKVVEDDGEEAGKRGKGGKIKERGGELERKEGGRGRERKFNKERGRDTGNVLVSCTRAYSHLALSFKFRVHFNRLCLLLNFSQLFGYLRIMVKVIVGLL